MVRIGVGCPWIRGRYELSEYTTREIEATTLSDGNENTSIPTQLFVRNQVNYFYIKLSFIYVGLLSDVSLL
jgi:hypothetical protein